MSACSQRSSSRLHKRHGTHTRNRDPLCDFDVYIFYDIYIYMYLDYQYEQASDLDAPQKSYIYQVILGNEVANLEKI
mgnify:CR=1 FL=1